MSKDKKEKKKKSKKSSNRLSARDLQITLLRYLLAHPKKQFSPRQLAGLIKSDNNKDSVEHALRQLMEAGSVLEHREGGKFGAAIKRLTLAVDDQPARDEEEEELNHKSHKSEPNEVPTEALGERKSTQKARLGAQPIAEMPSERKRAEKTRQPDFERPAAKTPRPTRGKAEEEFAPEPVPDFTETSKKRQRTESNSARKADQRPAPAARKIIEGVVDMTRTGAAYVVTDLMESDVYIPMRHVNGALNGDLVCVQLFPPQRQHRGGGRRMPTTPRKPEGEVVKVLKRATEFFIGTLRLTRKYAVFLPDNPLVPIEFFVPFEAKGEARDGDKVVMRVTDWQEGLNRPPVGKVTQVLGDVGGHNFEMQKILINAGFELSHSDEALEEAAKIPDTISPLEIERRRDFRDTLTFTIDPVDAKDFDDALSIKQLDNGNLEIGVHIADVTHYLKPDTPLDREAYKRSTSVYLVDRCLPMLPEKLSNHLCSLVPHADRLTFSAVFEFDKKDKIVNRWFGKTVIHSAKRFSYEEAQTVLDGKPAETVSELSIYPQLEWALQQMQRLAKKMRKEREKNGAIGFESDEVRFVLDDDGTPVEAYVKERRDTNLLIEDFMLLANKEVALYIDDVGKAKKEIPFVYRVHDLPDLERVAEFARFAFELGKPLKVDTPRQIAQSFNELMKAARTDERLKVLEPLAIRTMAKAIYTTENIGHYGLGFSHYTHFTSPIRRYSDVLVHRILDSQLNGQGPRWDKAKLEEKCKHISAQEKKAADAERESVKFKQVELIGQHIGEEFDGTVNGMVDRGFFVEIDGSHAEGMVEFRYLDDQYIVEEGRLRACGRRYGKVIKMGDRVRVRITAADLERRQIEMELVE